MPYDNLAIVLSEFLFVMLFVKHGTCAVSVCLVLLAEFPVIIIL